MGNALFLPYPLYIPFNSPWWYSVYLSTTSMHSPLADICHVRGTKARKTLVLTKYSVDSDSSPVFPRIFTNDTTSF